MTCCPRIHKTWPKQVEAAFVACVDSTGQCVRPWIQDMCPKPGEIGGGSIIDGPSLSCAVAIVVFWYGL